MKTTKTKKNGITVNDMLYNTLTTKDSKEPKYRNILEAMGYELVNNHDWSEYDYWGIKCADGKVLVISKDYGGKRALFKTASRVNTKNIKKVNLAGVIKTRRKPLSSAPFAPANLTIQYQNLKQSVKTHEWLMDFKQKEVDKLEVEFNRAKKILADYKSSCEGSVETFESFKNEHLKKGGD